MFRRRLRAWIGSRTSQRAHPRRRDDGGSVLVLALIYLCATGVAMIALMGWVSNGLNATSRFSVTRELELGASSTAELAMQNIRYTPLLSTTTAGTSYCWGGGPSSGVQNIDGNSFDAWCSTAWNPTSAATRVVTVSVCLASVPEVSCIAPNTSILRVTVTFDDYPPGGAAAVQGPCTDWGWCGEGMTVNSWLWA